jgi:hypothetical protein
MAQELPGAGQTTRVEVARDASNPLLGKPGPVCRFPVELSGCGNPDQRFLDFNLQLIAVALPRSFVSVLVTHTWSAVTGLDPDLPRRWRSRFFMNINQ